MAQCVCHGIQCIFILNRSVMWPEKKVSQKGALCSVLSFACQFLYKGGVQCPRKQCHGGIVEYFTAAPCLHAQRPNDGGQKCDM